jgi:hypothetical protein
MIRTYIHRFGTHIYLLAPDFTNSWRLNLLMPPVALESHVCRRRSLYLIMIPAKPIVIDNVTLALFALTFSKAGVLLLQRHILIITKFTPGYFLIIPLWPYWRWL